MPKTGVREVYLRLYNDPEKSAERIDRFLRTLPLLHRISLQNLIDDVPLTKEPEGRYVSDRDSD